jgi:predicted nuclease of restriction endonuclease-like (RecB) superfamily
MELDHHEYNSWIKELKNQFRSVQQKAARTVNSELLQFYWRLGADIIIKQKASTWGDGFLKQLSHDLMTEFPDVKGFSLRNIKYIRQWYLFYNQKNEISQQTVVSIEKQLVSQLQQSEYNPDRIRQQAVAFLCQIPWGHNIVIVSKSKSIEEAFYYVGKTLENGWSRSVLTHQIESGLFLREGKATTNFKATLPKLQSDLAQQTIKDPYIFDFLAMTNDFNERELEQQLVQHITKFLLELGAGFAYIGKQVQLSVGERDFFIDLLFYHTQLHCYVVVELKTGNFEPEHAGKLNFYIKTVDEQLRNEKDEPTIGILLCKEKDKLVAEYALSDIYKPMGISEYQLTHLLPDNLKSSLPSIEEIEKELGGEDA